MRSRSMKRTKSLLQSAGEGPDQVWQRKGTRDFIVQREQAGSGARRVRGWLRWAGLVSGARPIVAAVQLDQGAFGAATNWYHTEPIHSRGPSSWSSFKTPVKL